MSRVISIFVAISMLLLLARCVSSDDTGVDSPPQDHAARQMQGSRYSTNGNSIYALPELRLAARTLVGRIVKSGGGNPPRVALSQFSRRARKSSLGESIAQDLATLLVEEAKGRVEVYSRRKLIDASRELKRQQSDLFDQRTLVQLGRFAGVNFILLGHLDTESREEVRCDCQLLDVETTETKSGARFIIPLQTLSIPVFSRDGGVGEFTARLLSNNIDAERELRIGVFGTTRSRKDFAPGTDLVREISTEFLLRANDKIKIYNRLEIDRVIEELALESSDLFDEATQVQIGKFVGANCVLTGFAEIYRTFYKYNIQFIDVGTSRLLSGAVLCVERK